MIHSGPRQQAIYVAVLALAWFSPAAATDPTQTLSRVTTAPVDKAQFAEVLRMGFDWLSFSDSSLEFFADAEDLRRLAELGVPTQIEIADVQRWYEERLAEDRARLDGLGALQAGPATMGGFETFSEIVAHLDLASADHSSIISSKFSIGTTLEGNDIWAIKISDNPGVDESEPEVLLTSLTHAREPMGAAVTLGVMDYLTDNYGVLPWITDFVDTREIYIIPVVNPDGYLYNELIAPGGGGMWRKNRRNNGGSFGVDLNRNWGSHWGYDDFGSSPNPSSDTYRGSGAFSENETSALRDFILSRNFSVIHNHHSYGQLELWPVGYDRFFTVDEPAFQIIGSTTASKSTSTPQIGWALYPTNGEADDWAYSTLGVVSMTAEIGNEFWPLPSAIPGLRDDFIEANLYLIEIADNPLKVGPPRAPILLAPDSVMIDSFEILWLTEDNANTMATFHLIEFSALERRTDSAEVDEGYWSARKFSLNGARAHSGSFSWHEEGQNGSAHWIRSVTPVQVAPDDSLKFWMWYDIESDWDYFYVQASTDGGLTFVNLAHPSLTTETNPNGLNLGAGITGSSGGWIEAAFDLTGYAGQQVYLRFAYYTDYAVRGEGVYLDDINFVDYFGTEAAPVDFAAADPVSLTGVSDGVHYYRGQFTDDDGQIGPLSAIVRVVVDTAPSYVCGDADGGGTVNIGDATFLLDLIFSSGPEPSPAEAGDADGSGSTNIADVTYVIAYIFNGGPAPVCP